MVLEAEGGTVSKKTLQKALKEIEEIDDFEAAARGGLEDAKDWQNHQKAMDRLKKLI